VKKNRLPTLAEAIRAIGASRNVMLAELQRVGAIDVNKQATQSHIKRGLFVHEQRSHTI